jgi:hypothetical protein
MIPCTLDRDLANDKLGRYREEADNYRLSRIARSHRRGGR